MASQSMLTPSNYLTPNVLFSRRTNGGEDVKPPTDLRPQYTVRSSISFLHDDGNNDIDEESVDEAQPPSQCVEKFRTGLNTFCPGSTLVLMVLLVCIVTICLTIRSLSNNQPPPFRAYLIYTSVTASFFLLWSMFRVVWVFCISKKLIPEGRLIAALNAVLDPELFYLFATVTVSLFWSCIHTTYWACSRASGWPCIKAPDQEGRLQLSPESLRDLKVLLHTNLLLILWALRVSWAGVFE